MSPYKSADNSEDGSPQVIHPWGTPNSSSAVSMKGEKLLFKVRKKRQPDNMNKWHKFLKETQSLVHNSARIEDFHKYIKLNDVDKQIFWHRIYTENTFTETQK